MALLHPGLINLAMPQRIVTGASHRQRLRRRPPPGADDSLRNAPVCRGICGARNVMRRASMLDQPWRDEEAALPAPINAVAAYQAMRDLHHLDYLDLITIRGHPGVIPDQSGPLLKNASDLYQRTRSIGRLRAPVSRKCAISAFPRSTPSLLSFKTAGTRGLSSVASSA